MAVKFSEFPIGAINADLELVGFNSATPANVQVSYTDIKTDILAGAIKGTVAIGQVPFGSAANTVAGSNNLFWDNANGRLGIGTNAPIRTLDVNGQGNFRGLLYTPGGIFCDTAAARFTSLTIGVNVGAATAYLQAEDPSQSIGIRTGTPFPGIERLRVTAAGRLLLGTTSESTFLLDVNGSARMSGTIIGAGALAAGTGSIAFLGQATTGGNVHSAAIGYNAISSNSHAIAIGYDAVAGASPSFAFGRVAVATGTNSTAFSGATANGNYSVAFGNGSRSITENSFTTGQRTYGYLSGQITLSSNNMDYVGDSQTSIVSFPLNTGIVNSGGTYSFTGIRPNNQSFGSGVSQNWRVQVSMVFSVKGKTTGVTEFNLDDTFTTVYQLAVKSNSNTGTTIIGTPILINNIADTNMSGCSVSFVIVSNNLVARITPPTWASGQAQFRGTIRYDLTELGVYPQPF